MEENQTNSIYKLLKENLRTYMLELKATIKQNGISRDLANAMLLHRASVWKEKMSSNYEVIRNSAHPSFGVFMSEEEFFRLVEHVHNEILEGSNNH